MKIFSSFLHSKEKLSFSLEQTRDPTQARDNQVKETKPITSPSLHFFIKNVQVPQVDWFNFLSFFLSSKFNDQHEEFHSIPPLPRVSFLFVCYCSSDSAIGIRIMRHGNTTTTINRKPPKNGRNHQQDRKFQVIFTTSCS